jgi:hypothetical protein
MTFHGTTEIFQVEFYKPGAGAGESKARKETAVAPVRSKFAAKNEMCAAFSYHLVSEKLAYLLVRELVRELLSVT